MNCDLISFGRYISYRRKSFNYTQETLSKLSFISIDSLRRIENGKVHPTYQTLNCLSKALKVDLNKTLLNYHIYNKDDYFETRHKIEKKIANGLYDDLEKDLDWLQNFLLDSILDNYTSLDDYTSISVKQLALFLESIALNKTSKNYESALAKLIEAIQLTTPNYNLNNYSRYVYSNFEIRILMNIALLMNKLADANKSTEMLIFCLESVDVSNTALQTSIIYNLSYSFHRMDLHKKALYYSNKGINLCIENNNMHGLGLLYSRKGIAEFFLEDDNFMVSLNQAMHIYDMANQNNLKAMLMDFCNKHSIHT